MQPITKASLQSFCRTCLIEFHSSPATKQEEIYEIEETENLTKWLNKTCWPMEINATTDGYPKRICKTCFNKAQTFYKFREKTKCSVLALRELLDENLSELTVRNLQKFCRTCLKNLKSTDGLSNVSETPNVNVWLQMCTGYDANGNYDKFPRFLCAWCLKMLRNFVKFREITKDSLEYLAKIVDSPQKSEYHMNKNHGGSSTQIENITLVESTKNHVEREIVPLVKETVVEEEVTFEVSNSKSMPENVFAEKLPSFTKTPEIAEKNNNSKAPHNSAFNQEDFLLNINEYEAEELFPEPILATNSSDTRKSSTGRLQDHSESQDLNLEKNTQAGWTETPTVQYEKVDNPRKKTRKKNVTSKSNVSSQRIECEHCGKKFMKRLLYDAHVRGIHEGLDKPFRCEICLTYFRLYNGLKRHIKEIHIIKNIECNPSNEDFDGSGGELNSEVYQCKFCTQRFKRKEHLKSHQNSIHLGIKPFKCRFCEKSFAMRKTLRVHEMSHTGERPYTCDQCNKSFRQISQLKIHMEIHTVNAGFFCPICKRIKSSQQELDAHVKKHSQQYQCSKCGKIFKKKTHLSDHENAVHLKIRPFKCSHCDLTFSLAKTCRTHERVHSGDRPEVCLICGQTFKQRNVMMKHFKSHKRENIGAASTSSNSK